MSGQSPSRNDDEVYTWEDEYGEDDCCPACGGDGMEDDVMPCPHCDGQGYEWWK